MPTPSITRLGGQWIGDRVAGRRASSLVSASLDYLKSYCPQLVIKQGKAFAGYSLSFAWRRDPGIVAFPGKAYNNGLFRDIRLVRLNMSRKSLNFSFKIHNQLHSNSFLRQRTQMVGIASTYFMQEARICADWIPRATMAIPRVQRPSGVDSNFSFADCGPSSQSPSNSSASSLSVQTE